MGASADCRSAVGYPAHPGTPGSSPAWFGIRAELELGAPGSLPPTRRFARFAWVGGNSHSARRSAQHVWRFLFLADQKIPMSDAHHPQRTQALLMLLLANFFWGLSFPVVKAIVLLPSPENSYANERMGMIRA